MHWPAQAALDAENARRVAMQRAEQTVEGLKVAPDIERQLGIDPPHYNVGGPIGAPIVHDDLSLDAVNHPPHYLGHPSGIECIDVVEHMGFNLGNAMKYIWRADLKHASPIEDLEKARWYLDREIANRKRVP